jgi:hypothetical protein
MSNIDKRETELLIENGVLVADTLRHLAYNEIDSDYFAVCHTNENGTEIECELAITDYARQAAGTVDELVKALEAAERRNTELTEALRQSVIGYKSCLRMGYERILDLGGDCDSPEVMIAGNPDIQQAEKLLAAAAGKGE